MPENTGRKQDGTFQPGISGNPSGRPKGTLNQATIVAQSLIDGQAEAISQKAVDMALQGDPVALRLCLERLVPKRTDRPLALDMPVLRSAKDAVAFLAKITEETARGIITLSEAKLLSEFVSNYLKSYELAYLEERLEHVERALGS